MKKWKAAFNKLSKEDKTFYNVWHETYFKDISCFQRKMLDNLKNYNLPQEYINEIEYLIDYEQGKLFDSIVLPIDNKIKEI